MRTMSEIWDEAVAFFRQERALLVPVALATGPWGNILSPLVPHDTNGTPDGAAALIVPLCALLAIFGQLAITALALNAGLSVREALGVALRRLPTILGLGVIVGGVLLLLLLPIIVTLMKSGYDLTSSAGVEKLPPAASFAVLIVMALFLSAMVRLILANPIIVDRKVGPVAAMRGSFALTRGRTARLFGMLLLYGLVLIVITKAVTFVAGSLVMVAARAANAVLIGQVLIGIIVGIVAALLGMMFTVFIARYYRALSSAT